MKIKNYLVMAVIALWVVACSDDDEPEITTVEDTITINATSYADWTYINLETGATQVVKDYSRWYYAGTDTYADAQASESDITIDWHIAIHRFNVKTNNGGAVETSATELANLTAIPSSGYTSDVEITTDSGVITDLSGMMSGNVGYASSGTINEVLGNWVTRSGSMGAYVYTLSGMVYVVKFADGSYAKLKFTDHSNDEGTTGHVTFAYEYVK